MCRPASFVLTKNKVFWSLETDSHEDIVAEYKLSENGVRGIKILRVEVSPNNGDLSRPLKEWEFGYDQDLLPSWVNEKKDKKRVRLALKQWAKAKLFTKGEHVVKKGSVYLSGSSSAKLFDSSSAKLFGHSSVELFGHSSAELFGHSSARLFGHSSVELFGCSSAKLFDSSSAEQCTHHSTIRVYGEAKPCKPEGPYAAVIDCRKKRAKCAVGEK